MKFTKVLLLVIVFYLAFTFVSGAYSDIGKTVFSSPDSRTYLNAMFDIFINANTKNILIRPFLFPLLLVLFPVLGYRYVIFLNAMFYILAITLAHITSGLRTGSKKGYILLVLLLLNLSLISISYHALAEVFTVFLASVYFFLLAKYLTNSRCIYLFFAVFTTSLVAVTKPLYLVFFALNFVYFFPFTFKRYKKNCLVAIGVLMLPIMIQYFFAFVFGGSAKFSEIGSITFRRYYVAEVYASEEKITLEDSRKIVDKFPYSLCVMYLSKHPVKSGLVFIENILIENVFQSSDYVPKNVGFLSYYVLIYNVLLFIIFIALVLRYLYAHFCKRNASSVDLYRFSLLVFCALNIVSTGITFWQGDRILIPYQIPVILLLTDTIGI